MTDGSLILVFFQRIETGEALILKYVFKTGTGSSVHIFKELHNTGMFPQLNGNLGPTSSSFFWGLSAQTYHPNGINPTMSVDPHP